MSIDMLSEVLADYHSNLIYRYFTSPAGIPTLIGFAALFVIYLIYEKITSPKEEDEDEDDVEEENEA